MAAFEQKTVFIAGHTGLLGSHVLKFINDDDRFKVVTRTRSQLNLCDQHQVNNFFSSCNPDIVILAAGDVGGIEKNRRYPADLIFNNTAINLSVINAAYRSGVDKLVYVGSSCMYPNNAPQPMDEALLLTGQLEATSQSYSVAKLSGMQMCDAVNQQSGRTRFITVIPNTLYGAGDNFSAENSHVLPALIAKLDNARQNGATSVTLWGTGKPVRELVHASDAAKAILFLLGIDEHQLSSPYNIGGKGSVSIAELAKIVAETVGFKGEIIWDTSRPDGAPIKVLDCKKLKALGWVPKVDLSDGVADGYQWYLQHHHLSKSEIVDVL